MSRIDDVERLLDDAKEATRSAASFHRGAYEKHVTGALESLRLAIVLLTIEVEHTKRHPAAHVTRRGTKREGY